ncbi:MAG: glycerophosphodiester phosphodiesterase, partial [Bacteroidaceae bacterium]|nr:glycerophosphodiester phosphodiesterase [Bacteroidaceae bacterium]
MKRKLSSCIVALVYIAGLNAWALEPNSEGIYEIGSADDFMAFAELVNSGTIDANAVLTTDIDMAEQSASFPMIGTSSNPYAGNFDGQFHTISNLKLSRNSADVALFSYVQPGCTIQNLVLDETCSSEGADYTAGIVSRFTGSHQSIYLLNLGYEGTVTGTGKNSGAIQANSPSGGPITVMRNCYSTGKVSGSIECGQLSGWVGKDAIVENCWSTSEVEGYQNDGSYMYRKSSSTQTNCYSLYGTQATSISEEQIQSGELCFLLNGNQNTLNWYQTLGEDAHPTLYPNHSIVYVNGNLACDGVTPLEGVTTFSNTPGANIAPHTFDCGFCTICHAENPDFIVDQEDGYWQIGTAEQLTWFANKVTNLRQIDASAQLTADIDMAEYCDKFPMIGTSSAPYAGTFDGQFHTISNLKLERETDNVALFSYAQPGCTIQNLILDETCSASGVTYTAGIVSRFAGSANPIYLLNLGYEGTVTGTGKNSGAIHSNSPSGGPITVMRNCYSTGKISGAGECGQLSGWVGTNSIVENCWSTSEVIGYQSNDFYLYRRGSTYTIKNCYSLYGSQGTTITEEQIENGELCWLLNNGKFEYTSAWYETLGEDSHPVLSPTHDAVYKACDTYGSVNKVSLSVGSKAMSEALLAYTENEELTATQSLIEAYTTKARALAEATSWEELVDGYAELDAIGQSIRISQAAYVSYQNKVEEARTFLAENPDVSGEYCDILIKYLSEYLEKGGDFPNGSYSYIMDTHTLTTEELAAETDYMSLLLRQAVEGGYVKDSDVTNLLVNANFRNGFEGWKGIVGTGWGVSETSSVRVAECRNHAMDMYQIITGLKDGVYELQVSGAFHPYPEEDHQNTNYAAMLYANTLQNYFQAGIEDMVSVDDAVDGENCHLTGDAEDYMVINDGAEAGYIPHGIAGYSNAFQAGRYVNSILANVTDGTLTVGVKLAGTGNSTSDMTTTVTAHSGAYSTEANSMRFISTALIRRPDILEVDVRCRPNGTLAISHDAIASDEGGVELATVFAAVAKTSVRMNLDIKETATLEPLHTLIAEYGMEKQVFMTGLSEKDIELAKRDCPGIPYYLNYNPDTKRTDDEEYQQMILALLERTGSLGINCNYKYATKALASLLHKNGYLLSVWTVNAESDMRNMLALSPDNITTLNPDLLYSLMRNSNPAPDQLGFGKITLTYRGPLEESAQALDRVLASQAARANTILNNYEYSIDVDYASYPNFAQEIKDALQDAIDAIATTTEAEAKYALVERFSDLFQQVYDCKKAYVSLMTQAEWLVDASGGMNNVLDDEERQTLSDLMETLIEGYMDGTFSFEEAQQNYLANLPFILKKTDGVYQIGTGRELAIFSAMVNAGDHTANAVLTADIDMSDYSDKFVPIGSSAYPYAATFDGQFHTISHLNLTRETNDVALFGYVKPGCTIQNLLLDETCSSAGVDYTAGIVSRFTGNHQPIYLLNLGYEGTVSGTGKNSGAIHANSPSAGPITVMRNCYSTGNVSGSLECGQLSGWVGQDAIVENCWSTSEVSGYQNDASYMYRRGASYTQTNCYSLYGTQATSISE